MVKLFRLVKCNERHSVFKQGHYFGEESFAHVGATGKLPFKDRCSERNLVHYIILTAPCLAKEPADHSGHGRCALNVREPYGFTAIMWSGVTYSLIFGQWVAQATKCCHR